MARPVLETVRKLVQKEHFYKPSHGFIFQAICAVIDRGDPAEPMSVHAELRRLGVADWVLPGDVVALAGAGAGPGTARTYATTVANYAVARQVVALSEELRRAGERLRLEDVPPILEQLGEVRSANGGGGLSLRWVADAVNAPPPEPPVLIDGMLRAGELCVLGAPRGIGKSFFAANLGVLGGRGEGFLGGTLRVARPFRTLICQGEVDQWEASQRWQRLSGTQGPPEGLAESFDRWRARTVRRRSTNGNESREWFDALLDPRLEATIAEHGFDVLVIDPWAVYYAGAENSNDEAEAALDKLRDLSMRYHVAVLILHHLGKNMEGREPEDLWRGASRLADWASTRITLLPYYSPKQATDQGMTRQQARRYVNVTFLRRSAPTDDFSMVLNPATGFWERWVSPLRAAAGRAITLSVPDVVDACTAAGGSWPSLSKAAEALGMARGTAGKLLDQAVRAGALEMTEGKRGAKGYRLPGPNLGLA